MPELGYNIAKAPLYYVRSGRVHLTISSLNNLGFAGFSQSSQAQTANTVAFSLYFYHVGVNVSDGNYRWLGNPLRCQ